MKGRVDCSHNTPVDEYLTVDQLVAKVTQEDILENHENIRFRNNQYLREFNDARDNLDADHDKFADNNKIDNANDRMIEEEKENAI